MQRAHQGDVVDVMPRRLRQRAVLAPAGHAAVDQLRVRGEARFGPDAEPFHHARSKAFDERIGTFEKAAQRRRTGRRLQVECDRAAAPVEQFQTRVIGRRHLTRALDAEDLGAHVGQHHGGERAGREPGHLDHLDALQRSHGWAHSPPCKASATAAIVNSPLLMAGSDWQLS